MRQPLYVSVSGPVAVCAGGGGGLGVRGYAARKATGTTFEPDLDPFLQFLLDMVTLPPDIRGAKVTDRSKS
jgi:hypothetical protein